MSGIAGIVDLGGLPVEPGLLGAMADAISHRGPDGLKTWHDGPAGLAHSHFWTTPEDVGEVQPISSVDGRYWITADARIDNRDELIPDLHRAGTLHNAVPTDGEVILAAFEAWGDDCAVRLIGDFAFAIWDVQSKRLFAARDVIGLRQICYAITDNRVYFSNRVGAVLCALPQRPELNRELLEAFLLNDYRRWVTETAYRGIRRLPPAHSLAVSPRGVEIKEYYRLGTQPAPSFTKDSQWIEAFRGLLDRAIRCRLRSQDPVGVLMGGLDSSSIACRAHAMLDAGAELPNITLCSAVFDDTPGADEREYIFEVTAQCPRFSATQVVSDSLWALRPDETGNCAPMDEPDLVPLRAYLMTLIRQATGGGGGRVVLGGEGANQVLGHGVYYQPAAMRGLELHDLPSELRHFKKKSRKGWTSLLLRAFARPFLPENLDRLASGLLARRARSPAWVVRRGISSGSEPYSMDGPSAAPPGLTPSALVAYRSLRNAFDLARYAWLDTLSAQAGAELRFPYLDRRVAEFVLQAPPRLRSWRGVDRVLLREAMKGSVPEKVRTRLDKNHIQGLFHRGLHNQHLSIDGLLRGSRAEAMGFMKAGRLRDALGAFRQGRTDHWNDLFMPLSLEAWLRQGNTPHHHAPSGEAVRAVPRGGSHV